MTLKAMRPASATRFRLHVLACSLGKQPNQRQQAYNLRLALFLRRLSKNQAKNGSNNMEPGIAQINKYGLTFDADRTISLSLFFSLRRPLAAVSLLHEQRPSTAHVNQLA